MNDLAQDGMENGRPHLDERECAIRGPEHAGSKGRKVQPCDVELGMILR